MLAIELRQIKGRYLGAFSTCNDFNFRKRKKKKKSFWKFWGDEVLINVMNINGGDMNKIMLLLLIGRSKVVHLHACICTMCMRFHSTWLATKSKSKQDVSFYYMTKILKLLSASVV